MVSQGGHDINDCLRSFLPRHPALNTIILLNGVLLVALQLLVKHRTCCWASVAARSAALAS